MTNQSLSELFHAETNSLELTPGTLLEAIVLSIDKDFVILDVGLKSDGAVAVGEFKNSQGEISVAVGDTVQVVLEAVDNGFGETLLSREKAKRCEAWIQLEKAYENSTLVSGIINGRVKGGFTVQLEDIRAFLPGSLVDIRPLRDTAHLEGKLLEFKILKLDQKRNNVVVSRKAALMSDQEEEREKLLEVLQEGMVLKGTVKNLTDYGAFIELGGIDGLLHITDMAWRRVRHPNEIVHVGDELTVQVLKFDRERMRVSLGLKQLTIDPWEQILSKYEKGTKIKGCVTNLTDYGCFVGLEGGIEGLVHISEMDWVHKNVHPSKLVKIGDAIEVMILELDAERRRISLGLKQCKPNPWQNFSEAYPKGSEISGEIHSITEFGLFVGLEGGIDGLVHLTDLSWTEPGEKALQKYTKGQIIQAVVLNVEVPRERISLGVKQLTESPVAIYLGAHPIGSITSGEFSEIDSARKVAKIALSEQVFGEIPLSQISNAHDLKASEKISCYIKEVTTLGRFGPSILVLSLANASDSAKLGSASSGGQIREKEKAQQPMNAMAEAFRIAREEANDK